MNFIPDTTTMVNRVSARLLTLSALFGLVFAAGSPVAAQIHTWNTAASANINVGPWTPSAPTLLSGADETLNFGSFLNATIPGYTVTTPAGSFFTRVINFNNTYGTPAITIANTGTLTFNSAGGFGAQLNQNGFGLASIGAFTMANNLLIGGSGTGNLTVSGAITNAGSILTVNQAGSGFSNTGASVIFGGAGTWGGGATTVINGGNVAVGNATAFGSVASNTITFNAGSFRFNGTLLNLANNFSLNNTMTVLHSTGVSGTNTVSGVISGSGGLRIVPVSGLTLALTGANTFSGDVVYRGTNNGLGFGITLSGVNGSMANVNNITITSNSSLILDNLTVPSGPRLNAGATLNLNSARLFHLGNATTATSTTIGTLNTLGQALIGVYPSQSAAAGGGSTLTIGTLNRLQNSTLQIFAANMGQTPGAGVGSIVITNNPGGSVAGILPYAVAGIGVTTHVNTFVRWDAGTQQLIGLSHTTDYQGGATPAMELYRNANTAANYRATASQGAMGNTTVNSLILDTNGATAQFIGTSIAGPGTVNVTSGALMGSIFSGTQAPTPVASTVGVNTLAFGASTAYIHAANNLNITSIITGTGGLVKSGINSGLNTNLILTGNNTFSGDVYVNAGNVSITTDSNLGNAGNAVRLNSGNLNGLIFNPSNLFTHGSQTSLATSRNIILGESGGSVLVQNFNNRMTANGVVSGNGFFFKGGFGTLVLNGANTYIGETLVFDGVLVAANDAALGNAANDILFVQGGGGVLQAGSSFATSRNVVGQSAIQFFTNGNNLTLNGIVGSQNNVTPSTLTKHGTGDLILSNTNTYNGATSIGLSTGSVIRSEMSAAQTGGRLVLIGANGSIAMSSGIVINNGSTLRLDNSAAVNNLRVGRVGVTMNAGTLEIAGNATANSSTAIGTLNSSTFANTITLDQTGGTGSTTNTLTVTSYTNPASSQMTFVRGSNLGAVSGNRAAVLFNTAPTTVFAGILPSFVGSDSASGSPTEFLRLGTPVGGQTPLEIFTAYSIDAPNAGAGFVADIATNQVLGAASTIGAARLSAGDVDLAGFGWNVQSGSMITSGTRTITNSGALASLTLGGTAVGGGATAGFGRITNNGTLTIGTNVQIAATNLTKFGAGDLVLNQAATSITTLNVAQGTLRYGTGVAAALPVGTTVNLAPGANLDLNNNAGVTLVNVLGFGNMNIGSGGLTQSGQTGTFAGTISGSGAITMNGTGTYTVTGNNSGYTGNWNVNAGSLTVGSNNALGSGQITLGNTAGATAATLAMPSLSPNTVISNNIVVQLGSTAFKVISVAASTSGTLSGNIAINDTNATSGLRITGSGSSSALTAGAWTLSGNISGGGNVSWFNGNYNLWGNNSAWSGTMFMDANAGVVIGVGTDTALGTGLLDYTAFGGMLRADNGARTLVNNIRLLADLDNFSVTGVNDLTLNGTVLLNTAGGSHVFNIASTGTTTFGGVISGIDGAARLTQNGFGTVVLNGPNTFGGGYTLNSGVLGMGNDSALGTGALTVNEGGILRATGGTRTIGNAVTVAGNFGVDGSIALTMNGAMGLGAATRTVVVRNTANTTFGGIISGAAGTGLTKEGAGTLILTNNNTYDGTTTVAQGTLLANNVVGTATGLGNVVVNAGATLGGVGFIVPTGGNSITINGTVAPGNSSGMLTFGSIATPTTVNLTGLYAFELSTAGTGGVAANSGLSSPAIPHVAHDVMNVFGTMNLAGSTINLTSLGATGFNIAQSYSWLVGTTNGGVLNGLSTINLIAGADFTSAPAGNFSLGNVGGNFYLNYQAVPEPGTLGLLGLGLMLFTARRRVR